MRPVTGDRPGRAFGAPRLLAAGVPAWANGYVGVPFEEHGRSPKAWDCWGLLWWCYRAHFGIALESFAGAYSDTQNPAALAAIMGAHMTPWRKLRAPLEGGERPQLGDGVLLRINGHPCHVGLVVDRRRMLHVERRIRTQFEDFDGLMWRRRVAGIYRHRELDHA